MSSNDNFFQYLEQSTWQEKDEIANQLKMMYNTMLDAENICYAEFRESKGGIKARLMYVEALGKLSVIQGVFDLLHIDCEYGKKFDIDVPFS